MSLDSIKPSGIHDKVLFIDRIQEREVAPSRFKRGNDSRSWHEDSLGKCANVQHICRPNGSWMHIVFFQGGSEIAPIRMTSIWLATVWVCELYPVFLMHGSLQLLGPDIHRAVCVLMRSVRMYFVRVHCDVAIFCPSTSPSSAKLCFQVTYEGFLRLGYN